MESTRIGFNDLASRLGNFHTTGVFMAVVGKRFAAAGYRREVS